MKYLLLLLLPFNVLAHNCNSDKEEILKSARLDFNRYNELIIDSICNPSDKSIKDDLEVNIKSGNITITTIKKVIKVLK